MFETTGKFILSSSGFLFIAACTFTLSAMLNSFAPIRSLLITIFSFLPALISYWLIVQTSQALGYLELFEDEHLGFIIVFGLPILYFLISLIYFVSLFVLNRKKLGLAPTNNQWRVLVVLLALLLALCVWYPTKVFF